MAAAARWRERGLKTGLFLVALGPAIWLGVLIGTDGLGANPIEAAIRYLGDWALRFVLIVLAVTPLRALTGWTVVARFRRMIGLFAFFYAMLHVSGYIFVDQALDFEAVWEDIVKRRYITVGVLAFLMMTPLAVTSTNAMARRLGGRAWRRLHRLVYTIGIAGVLHFYMMVKADVREPLAYAAILSLLLIYRLVVILRRGMRPITAQAR